MNDTNIFRSAANNGLAEILLFETKKYIAAYIF
jgi:hypothetical protein